MATPARKPIPQFEAGDRVTVTYLSDQSRSGRKMITGPFDGFVSHQNGQLVTVATVWVLPEGIPHTDGPIEVIREDVFIDIVANEDVGYGTPVKFEAK